MAWRLGGHLPGPIDASRGPQPQRRCVATPIPSHRVRRPGAAPAIASDHGPAATAGPPSTDGNQGSGSAPLHAEPPPPQQGATSIGSDPRPSHRRSIYGNRPSPSIYWWPATKDSRDRPPFLQNYPTNGPSFNINSFLGPYDTHHGKFVVPPQRYARFLAQYHEAFHEGYQLFLAEVYGSQPFRYFVELDFDWNTPQPLVEELSLKVYPIIREAIREAYNLTHPPFTLVSMRTCYKVHLNCPWLVTTELHAMMCREKIIDECRKQLGTGDGTLDWESIVDFPHGSFRMIGSRKTKIMTVNKEPLWVADKAYYPVRQDQQHNKWVPVELTLERVMQSSIIPTVEQRQRFEKSSAYLGMIYADVSAYEQKMRDKVQKRLEAQVAQLQRLEELVDGASGQQGDGTEAAEEVSAGGVQEGEEDEGGREATEHRQRVIKSQLGKVTSLKMAAMKLQEERALHALAAKSGEVGRQFVETSGQLERVEKQVRMSQSRLSLLQRQLALGQKETDKSVTESGTGSGEGEQKSDDMSEEIGQLDQQVKGLQRLKSQLGNQLRELTATMTGVPLKQKQPRVEATASAASAALASATALDSAEAPATAAAAASAASPESAAAPTTAAAPATAAASAGAAAPPQEPLHPTSPSFQDATSVSQAQHPTSASQQPTSASQQPTSHPLHPASSSHSQQPTSPPQHPTPSSQQPTLAPAPHEPTLPLQDPTLPPQDLSQALASLSQELHVAKQELKRVQSPYSALQQLHKQAIREGKTLHQDDVKLCQELEMQVKWRSRHVSQLMERRKALTQGTLSGQGQQQEAQGAEQGAGTPGGPKAQEQQPGGGRGQGRLGLDTWTRAVVGQPEIP